MSSRHREDKHADEGQLADNLVSLDNLPISPVTQTHPNQTANIPKYGCSTLKDFTDVKLTHLIEPINSMMQMDKYIPLVTSNSGSIHLHDEALTVFQRYSGNDIAFVGLWGSTNSDKNRFYQSIFALADATDEEVKHSKSNLLEDSSTISFFTRPFTKNNIKIFLLNTSGFKNQKLTTSEKMVFDILMTLCQVIVLIQDNQDHSKIIQNQSIPDIGFKHFKECLFRLYNNNSSKKTQYQPSEIEEKGKLCWPENLFMLYSNYQNIRKQRQNTNLTQLQLSKLFQTYSFSILHNNSNNSHQNISLGPTDELYLKNTSTIFKQIYSKIHGKFYHGLKYRGNTCPHILVNLTHTLNTKQSLYLPKNFGEINKAVYQSIFNMHALSYVIKLKEYIRQSKPYSSDYLLAAFQQVYNEIIDDYDESCKEIHAGRMDIDSKNYQQFYEQKLQDYIQQKEKNILTVNTKKSLASLSQKTTQNQQNKLQWNNELKTLFQSYHKEFEYKNIDENQYDDNGKSYHVASKMKTIFTHINKEPSVNKKKRQETKELSILRRKRNVELGEAIRKRKIQEQEFKDQEMEQLNKLKIDQKYIDLKILDVENLLDVQEQRYQQIIKDQEERQEKKKKIQALEYRKEELQKLYFANTNLKKELDQECSQDQLKFEGGKEVKEIEMLKDKLEKKRQEVEKYEQKCLEYKTELSRTRKAEMRGIDQKNIRRSTLR